MNRPFKFELDSKVNISLNQKAGNVKARIEYADTAANKYLVEYVDGKGDVTEDWFNEYQLYVD